MSEDPGIYGAQSLDWSEISDAAENIFKVWMLGSELEWARNAWGHLKEARMTDYNTALEETRVLIRLLALAAIYHDFCALAYEESWEECQINDWAEQVELNRFRLAQLAGGEFESDDLNASAEDLEQAALGTLVSEERPVICAALIQGFGDVVRLAQALFATSRPPGKQSEADDDLFDDGFGPASVVLGWIVSGMRERC